MNTEVIKKGFKTFISEVSKNAPTILTCVSVVGTITTVILAVKATPKAEKLIKEEQKKRKKPMTYGDCVKAAWKPFVPVLLSGSATIASTIGSNVKATKQLSAATSALAVSERAFSEYRTKVKEEFGEKKEQKVRDDIAKDHVQKAYNEGRKITITGKGDSLYMEEMTGQIFRSSRTAIDKAINHCNARLREDDSCDYSTLLDALGLDRTVFSDNLYWDTRDVTEIIPVWSHPIYGDEGEGEPIGVFSFDMDQMRLATRDHYWS